MSPRRDDPYAVFRPRLGRYVALAAGAASLLLFVLIALLIPGGVADRLVLALCGVAVAGLLARYAAIVAVPGPEGIRVRNLFITRDIRWTDVEQVQLRQGDPWPALLLHDTDQVAVMAIQRSDGLSSRAEVGRLVALVEHHGHGAPLTHPELVGDPSTRPDPTDG